MGVGVRHALFPDGTLLGASLSRALCFPTPLSAACRCFGLMAGPFRPFPVGIYRVRSFRPVRPFPAGSSSPDVVRTRLQFLISRVGTFATGTAPAFDRTFAPRYGSDLLTLRLRSLLQRGDAFFAPPQLRRLTSFARLAHSPPLCLPCAPGSCERAGSFGGVGPPGNALAFWSAQ